MMSLRGGVVVTGGGRGIGAAIARDLVRDHAVCVLEQDMAGRDIPGGIPNLYLVEGSALDTEALANACRVASDHGGGLIGFVANVGANRPGPAAQMPRADLDFVIETCLTATFLSAQAAYQARSAALSVVTISSIASSGGTPNRAAYTAAKSGIEGLVRALAIEWARDGVRVNAVAPGYIATRLLERSLERAGLDAQRIAAKIPLGRLGAAEEIAPLVRFLLSEKAAYLTGAIIPLDGGASAAGLDFMKDHP